MLSSGGSKLDDMDKGNVVKRNRLVSGLVVCAKQVLVQCLLTLNAVAQYGSCSADACCKLHKCPNVDFKV
jgi:hypothetical protein